MTGTNAPPLAAVDLFRETTGRDTERTSNGSGPDPAEGDNGHRVPLEIVPFADLAARVDAAGPRRWLIRGIWPEHDYGVIGAEHKAQKSWMAIDLAVSVASGGSWLDQYEIDTPGAVVLFAGEGGEGNIVRRVRAVAEQRGVDAEALPIHVCTRAPHLNSDQHMALMAEYVDRIRPALVIIDPFYLAAQGAKAGDLYGMGGMLERPQLICQEFGSSLVVIHHFNRNKGGEARDRFSGAGPAEWARVLIGGEVRKRRTEMPGRKTTVTVRWSVIGGEVPDQAIDVTREIWSDDPDNLGSPLHLTVAAARVDDAAVQVDDDGQLRADEKADIGEWADPMVWPLPRDVMEITGRGSRAVQHAALYMRAHAADAGGVGVSRAELVKALQRMQHPDGKPLYRDETVIRRAWSSLVASGRLEPRTKNRAGVALWVTRGGDPDRR